MRKWDGTPIYCSYVGARRECVMMYEALIEVDKDLDAARLKEGACEFCAQIWLAEGVHKLADALKEQNGIDAERNRILAPDGTYNVM